MNAPQSLVRSFAIAFVLLAASALPMRAGVNRWTSLGPRSEAFVNALVADPAATDRIYVATRGGGVFKSVDGGETWTAINAGLDDGNVTALVIDPETPATLYAATFGSGVFKTTDGGETWRRAAAGIVDMHLTALALDTAHPATLYAGSSGGDIYKTSDAAETWGLARTWRFGINRLAVSSGSPSSVYAVISGGLYGSQDGGNTWREILSDVGAIAPDPRDSRTLYVAERGQLVKTTDGGTTWRGAGFSSRTLGSIAISPSAPAKVLIGTSDGLYLSTDAAATWQRLAGLPPREDWPRALLLSGEAATTCLVAREATLLKGSTENGDAPFRTITAGLDAASIWAVAPSPPDSSTLLATDGFRLLRSGDGGQSWTGAGTGSTTFFSTIAWMPGSPSTALAGGAGALRSEDSGLSWQPMSLRGVFSFDSASSDIYAGTIAGLQKSSDGGRSWRLIGSSYPPTYSVLADRFDDSRLFAVHLRENTPFSYLYYSYVDRSSDGGVTWKYDGKGLPELESSLSNLVAEPNDPTTLYVGLDGKGVYKTTDGAVSWKPANAGLEDASVRALAMDPAATLYAATDRGVYRSPDGGATWLPFNDGLTNLQVFSLAVDSTGRVLHAGTGGGGLFTLEIAPPPFPCEADVGRACLLAGRFQVTASARPPTGNLAKEARPVSLADGFGAVSLGAGDAAPDIYIKMVDGRSLPGGAFWLFHAGLTTDSYALTVTDTATGRVRIYQRSSAQFGCGGIDTLAFPVSAPEGSANARADSPSGGGETLSLSGGRYQVTLSATDARSGRVAAGFAVSLGDLDGYFSLPDFMGDPAIPEALVRIREQQDGSFVFSHAGLTDLSYVLTVTDSSSGAVSTYANDTSDNLHPCGGSAILPQ